MINVVNYDGNTMSVIDSATDRVTATFPVGGNPQSVANYDEAFGYIWNELEVTVTFESDWRAAKRALIHILEAQSEKIDAHVRKRIDDAAHILHIKFPKVTPAVWTGR